MPFVMLSASEPPQAVYCNGATEGAVMQAILPVLQDYLQVSGLRAALRAPETPPSNAALQAKRFKADILLHVGSGQCPANAPQNGVQILFHPAAMRSRRLALLLQENLRKVAATEFPVRVLAAPQESSYKVAHCPAARVVLGSRHRLNEAQWLLQRPGAIAHALAGAITHWCELPLKSPFSERSATVKGQLALRRIPSPEGDLLLTLQSGAKLTLLHREGEWQYVEIDGHTGYVMRKFLDVVVV